MSDLLQKIKESHKLLCLFHAPWCAPSVTVLESFDIVAEDEEFRDMDFLDVALDSAPQVAKAFQVKGTPTIMYFLDGEPQASILGTISLENLFHWVSNNAKDKNGKG